MPTEIAQAAAPALRERSRAPRPGTARVPVPTRTTPARRTAEHGLGALLSDLWAATKSVLGRSYVAPRGEALEGFRCALCDGSEARELYVDEIPDARGYTLGKCEECSLVAIHPMPEPAAIPDFYGETYYGEENAKFGPVTEFFVFLFRLARIRAIRMMGVKRGTILDIGCARGLFLKVLERVGHTAYGTELSPDSARAAKSLMGEDRIRVGPLVGAGFDTAQFDAITAWQVFEHLHDPNETLEECRRVLKPGGALLFAVPNIESWQSQWGGAEWFHADLPRHLFHYGPATITQMLARHGFEVESISHYCLEQNPFGLLQSALHRLGYAHMGLYTLLRGPLDRINRNPVGRLARYLVYLAAFPFAACTSYAWSLLGSGATFTVLARRLDD